MRLSIRYKILTVLGSLLLAAVFFYTVLASFVFVEQKTELLYEINHSVAVNTASQIRSILMQTSDEMRLLSITQLFNKQSGIQISQKNHAGYLTKASLFKKTPTGFEAAPLTPTLPALPFPAEQIKALLDQAIEQQYAFIKETTAAPERALASKPETETTYLLATHIQLSESTPQSYVAVGALSPQTLIEPLQNAVLFESFLLTPSGEALLSVNKQGGMENSPLANHPLVASIQRNPTSSGTQDYEFNQKSYLGAYAPVGMGNLWFLSQTDQEVITSALDTLLQRSLLFGLIVATLTFIASILFSKRLTRDLKTLTFRAQQIRLGDWGSKIQIRSGDEIETLAVSFNSMVEELRSSHEAIERHNHELEEKVELRTQQLKETNAAIKDVQEKLLQSTQLATVGEIAGRTAHELLNPLTAILSRLERSLKVLQPQNAATPAHLEQIFTAWEQDYRTGGIQGLSQSLQTPSTVKQGANLLEEDLDNLKQLAGFWSQQSNVLREDIQFVHQQADRIHRIIDKMREYVRASVKTDVYCHLALDTAIKTLEDFLNKHSIKILKSYKAEQDLAHLNGDELVQIITNLIRNAFQSIQNSPRAGHGVIQVKTEQRGERLCIHITDNGAGITQENVTKLFEQGFTTKAPTEGTGLGLAICRRYARAFGGDVIFVNSDPKQNETTFEIQIPLKTS